MKRNWQDRNAVSATLYSAFLFPVALRRAAGALAVLVPYFNVNQRLFPHLSAVWEAGVESIEDGSLPKHIGRPAARDGRHRAGACRRDTLASDG